MVHGRLPKKKTKRETLKMKYKIQKKVRDHKKKVRKEMKKNPGKFKKKRDVGVPNSFPFKADVLKEVGQVRELEKEYEKRRVAQLKLRKKDDTSSLAVNNVNDIIKDATEKQEEFEMSQNMDKTKTELTDKSNKTFYKEFKKVVEGADVILEVLDARDPLGTRCYAMEDMVAKTPNKRIVFVLNKADLVPMENSEAWVKHLRRERPTILFKASTQQQSKNISQSKAKWKHLNLNFATPAMSQCVGADSLMQLLKNYCRNSGMKTAITVGVVGLPNVGKSSIINSLKRSKACNVGATPGVTRNLQEVLIDSKIRLLDCPGLILPGGEASDAAAALRNAVRVEALEDPVTPVQAILDKTGKEYMMLLYLLPSFKDVTEFLSLIAKKSGKLGKDGVPNVDEAAKKILNDWNTGKIKYFTNPPADSKQSKGAKENSAILDKMSKEFRLEDCEGIEAENEEMDVEDDEDELDELEKDDAKSSVLPKNINIPVLEEAMEEDSAPSRARTAVKSKDRPQLTLKALSKNAARKKRKERNRKENK